MTSPARRFRAAVPWLLLTVLVVPLSPVAGQSPPSLDQVLERTGRYVVSYAEQMPLLLATESYSQWKEDEDAGARAWHRTLIGEFVLVRLDSGDDWVSYRDVRQVDDKRLGPEADRLRTLFVGGGARAGNADARRLTAESSTFNMAPLGKSFNTPTMALFFFRPANQPRFEFKKAAEEAIDGVRVWRIKYKETTRPTLFRGPNGTEMPVEGSVWVAPDDGRVFRTHMEIALRAERSVNRTDSLASVIASYRADGTDGLLVPAEMKETYEFMQARSLGYDNRRAKVNCTATYTSVERPRRGPS
jgi:hypothetical protein